MSDYNTARNWNMDEIRAKVLELQRSRLAVRQNVVGGNGIRKYFQFNSR